jgi:hypothetical protein
MLETLIQKMYEEATLRKDKFNTGAKVITDDQGASNFNTFLYLNQPQYFEVDTICKQFNKNGRPKKLDESGCPENEVQGYLKKNGFQKAIEEKELVPFSSDEIDIFLSLAVEGFWLEGDAGNHYMLIGIT